MAFKTNPTGRQNDLVIQELKGEILIYDLAANTAFCLNRTSARIYQLCDGRNSVADISRKLTEQLKSPITEDFVWLAIDQLKEDNLLDYPAEAEPAAVAGGISRREALKKAALTSAVALPVVSSLLAPTAAMAQSATVACLPPGVMATATAPNNDGRGLFACLTAASQKCCNVPPFAVRSRGPNICDGFSCSCTYDCE